MASPWTVIWSGPARRQLDKLDDPIRDRLLVFVRDRLEVLEDPRSMGDALHGPRFEGLWKYKVGPYRLIGKIQDQLVCITVVRVGHRKEVYR